MPNRPGKFTEHPRILNNHSILDQDATSKVFVKQLVFM